MAKRKLVLHFDVHKTVMVADSGAEYGPEEALNAFLTDVTWGKEEKSGTGAFSAGLLGNVEGESITNSAHCPSLPRTNATEWVWHSHTPSIKPPREDSVNYYRYLEGKLVGRGGDRADLRATVGRFTDTEQGRVFKHAFNVLTGQLGWKHHSGIHNEFTILGESGQRYHCVLPSFLKLFYSLQEEGRDFSVILRTFGQDAFRVLDCLQKVFHGEHPDIAGQTLPLRVNCNPGRISRFKVNSTNQCEVNLFLPTAPRADRLTKADDIPEIKIDIFRAGKEVSGTGVLTSDWEIYRHLTDMSGVCAFVDDYQFWRNHQFSHLAAKPLWIDLNDRFTQHIFFDDNIRPFSGDNIVDVRLINAETKDVKCLNLSELQKFQDSCLVQTNLLKSIGNPDYFMNKIEVCEKNYDVLLQKIGSASL